MAVSEKRSEFEKHAIIQRCLELEKQGGDILAYLRTEHYLTPRATWINFQRGYLQRKPLQITDGHPDEHLQKLWEKRKEKGMENIKKSRIKMTPEVKMKAVQIAIDGGDPRPYLGNEIGMADPQSCWWKIREELRTMDPDTYDKLPPRLPNNSAWKDHSDIFHNKRPPKVDKGMPKKLQLEGGQNYELSVAETPEAPKAEELAQKAEITKPLKFGGCEVTAVRDTEFNIGEFYYDHKYDIIDWRTPGRDEVGMTPEGWQNLARRLPELLGVLGVQV